MFEKPCGSVVGCTVLFYSIFFPFFLCAQSIYTSVRTNPSLFPVFVFHLHGMIWMLPVCLADCVKGHWKMINITHNRKKLF